MRAYLLITISLILMAAVPAVASPFDAPVEVPEEVVVIEEPLLTAPEAPAMPLPMRLAEKAAPVEPRKECTVFCLEQKEMHGIPEGEEPPARWQMRYKLAKKANPMPRFICDPGGPNSNIVPEPTSLLTLAFGAGALLPRLRRRSK